MNDVKVERGRGGQGFCDNSTKVLVIKSVMMRGGGKTCPKLSASFMNDPLGRVAVNDFARTRT